MEYFNLTVTSCPPGLVLLATDVEDEYKCQCNNNNDQNIVDCLPNQRRIILEVVSYQLLYYCNCFITGRILGTVH